jgi:hypothetical protein
MKKLITTALLSLAAVSSWAQGTVDFRNGGTITFATAADRAVYLGAVGGQKLVGTNYAVGLWFVSGTDGRPLVDFGGTKAGPNALMRNVLPTAATAGIWSIPASAAIVTLPNIPIGGASMLQVRAWDNLKYADFAAALAAGEYGVSVPFAYTPPAAGSPPAAYYMENMRAFAVVPEPSTIALGILGAASLLFLRRRK